MNEEFKMKEDTYVTLAQMLAFREQKVDIQDELKRKYKEAVIVTLGMNIPGPKKTDAQIRKAFDAGVSALQKTWKEANVCVEERRMVEEPAGNLAFYALSCSGYLDAASFIKKWMVQIEETHPFGRLYDIDVYGADGKGIGRQDMGLPARKCLICGKDAKICGRSRSHSVEELQQKVYEIIQNAAADR